MGSYITRRIKNTRKCYQPRIPRMVYQSNVKSVYCLAYQVNSILVKIGQNKWRNLKWQKIPRKLCWYCLSYLTLVLNKNCYFSTLGFLQDSLYLGHFLAYIDPIYHFGIVKVCTLSIQIDKSIIIL